jgi:hypothetical protein
MQPEPQTSSRSSSHSTHSDSRTFTNQHGILHHGAAPAGSFKRGSAGRRHGQDGSSAERSGERGRDQDVDGTDASDDPQEATRLRSSSPGDTEHPITRYERASSTSPERAFVAPVLLSTGRKGFDSTRASPIAILPNGTSTTSPHFSVFTCHYFKQQDKLHKESDCY